MMMWCSFVVLTTTVIGRLVAVDQQMDWWGLPDAVATAGKLFEYRLDQMTDDDDDDDYGSATVEQRLLFDVFQVVIIARLYIYLSSLLLLLQT